MLIPYTDSRDNFDPRNETRNLLGVSNVKLFSKFETIPLDDDGFLRIAVKQFGDSNELKC